MYRIGPRSNSWILSCNPVKGVGATGSGQVVRCNGRVVLLPFPGLGAEPEGRERLRSFRLRFCASSCFFFFFTEGFS